VCGGGGVTHCMSPFSFFLKGLSSVGRSDQETDKFFNTQGSPRAG